jgi:hypothetical protein
MKRRSNLILYLVLNIIVSAATTLAVLTVWDYARKANAQPALASLVGEEIAGATAPELAVEDQPAADPPAAEPTETLPPADQAVIQIVSVIGVGDLSQEYVLIRRVGEGNLRMTGWQLRGERGSLYTFPAQPELTLYKDGAVLVYSKAGDNTATDVYWNRAEPAWESGEVVKLFDYSGIERASYIVP